jgi:Protein of unknown function (DUF3168)
MTSPIVALKDAIRLRLTSDAGVLALLREPKIFSDPPKHAAYPHIAFVAVEARENGTATDDGHLINLTLGIWTRNTGSSESLTIAAAVDAALIAMPASLAGHHLVNLTVRAVEPLALKDGETWRCLMRIRAVTEILQ